MNVGSQSYYQIYNNDKVLLDPSVPDGGDTNYPFGFLADSLIETGHDISAIDTGSIENTIR